MIHDRRRFAASLFVFQLSIARASRPTRRRGLTVVKLAVLLFVRKARNSLCSSTFGHQQLEIEHGECRKFWQAVPVDANNPRLFPAKKVGPIQFVDRHAGELNWSRYPVRLQVNHLNGVYFCRRVRVIQAFVCTPTRSHGRSATVSRLNSGTGSARGSSDQEVPS